MNKCVRVVLKAALLGWMKGVGCVEGSSQAPGGLGNLLVRAKLGPLADQLSPASKIE